MRSLITRAVLLQTTLFIITIFSCERIPPPITEPSGSSAVDSLPVARAGSDATIFLPDQRELLLDGSPSYDPNGVTSLTYNWSKLSGPDVQNLNVNLAKASMIILDSGTYQFELTVKDVQELIGRDTVTITAVWGISCKPGTGLFTASYVLDAILDESIPVDVSVAAGSGKLVFAGGRTEQVDLWGIIESKDIYSSKFYIYDLDARTSIKKDLSLARGGIGIAIGSDEVFFAGGTSPDQVSDVVDIYDRRSGTMSKSNLSIARSSVSCGIAGNKVFFAGGHNSNGEYLDVVDIYDLSTKTWAVAKLSIPRAGISMVSSDSKVFFAGGSINWKRASSRVDIYDLKTGLWSVVELPEPRFDISSSNLGNAIVFSGGKNYGRNYGSIQKSNNANFLDLNSMAFTSECIGAESFNNTTYGSNLINAVLRA